MLDDYIIAKELMAYANISQGAYKFWNDVQMVVYDNSKTVFLHKKTIHKKYMHLVEKCHSLNGLIQASAFCALTNLPSSHLTKSNNSKIYNLLEIVTICNVKFVNIQKFYDDFNLTNFNTIYIEKCKYFAPLEKKIQLTSNLCLGYY
jgi:hypothetical protein